MKKLLLGVFSLALLAGCSSNPSVKTEADVTSPSSEITSPTSPPKTQPAAAAVGATITLEGQSDELLHVQLVKVVDPAPPAQYSTPQGRFVAAQLRLTNSGTVVYEDSPSNGAKLVDVDGQTYTTTVADTAAGPGFAGGSVKIAPGESRLGFITFDVPKGVKLVKFEFALNSGFADQSGQWTL